MKFVTSAYKKKLMEQKKWELQQQLEEEREQREDVTKKGMSGYVHGYFGLGFTNFCCVSHCGHSSRMLQWHMLQVEVSVHTLSLSCFHYRSGFARRLVRLSRAHV